MLKENTSKEAVQYDELDSSVTRTNEELLTLFERAELDVVVNEVQKNWPRGMFAVRTYVLRRRAKCD